MTNLAIGFVLGVLISTLFRTTVHIDLTRDK